MQTKDISDEFMLTCITKAQEAMQAKYPYWASKPTGEVWATLWGVEAEAGDIPYKLVLSKLDSLIRRKVIDGCTCGCRGDFYIL